MNLTEIKIKIISGTLRLVSKLPLKFHYFCGDVASWFMKSVLHYRRDVVMANISRSFPEMQYADVRKTVSAFYRHLGEIMAEAIWFGGSDYRRIHKSEICRITNLSTLVDAYNSSPSITVLGSHCGNWELIGGIWTYNYDENVSYPDTEDCVKVVYKRLRNPVWDAVMMENRRGPLKDFKGEIETNTILRYALKHRDRKFIYIYFTDQYPYVTKHDVGTFLNQQTKGMLGGAALAHKLGMSVLYLKMKHVSRGHYEMTFIPICNNASEMTPEQISARYFELLEEEIRETPYNWLWSHKRWKQ